MSGELPASVPAPTPPDDRAAWYAPAVRSQYAVGHGIVATVTETDDGYRYNTREPPLSESEQELRSRVTARFEDASLSRPRTRAGAAERVEAGLPEQLERRIGELKDRSPASRRRVTYYLLSSLRSLGRLTSYALDDRIRIADTTDTQVTVHTRDFAPAKTPLDESVPYLNRFLGERIAQRTVEFAGISVPVTIVRGHLLGADTFETTYVVEEPDRYPGDQSIIESVSEQLLESPPDGVLEDDLTAIVDRARTLLFRRIGFQPGETLAEHLPGVFGRISDTLGLTPPAVERTTRSDRIDALAYYVARDLVGDGPLTIPLRDPSIRSIEANRVSDRITVVTHRGSNPGDTRMPTTLSVEDRQEFVNLVRSLAADGGTELNRDQPTATVTLERSTPSGNRDLTCSVALPDGAESGHLSINAARETPPTPIALVERGQFESSLVAAIWTVAENNGSVLFVGPADAEPEAALGAHTPFIPAEKRPVEIGPGTPRLDLPHETAISVANMDPDGEEFWTKSVERDALHPDVAVLPGLDADHLEALGTVLASGRPVFGAVRTATKRLFERQVAAADVAHDVRSQVSLVVELPPPESNGSATGWIPVGEPETETGGRNGGKSADAQEIEWRQVVKTEADSGPTSLSDSFLERLRGSPESDTAAIEATVARRQQYVDYLQRQGSTDRDSLLGFLADLRTDEAATIERIGAQEQ